MNDLTLTSIITFSLLCFFLLSLSSQLAAPLTHDSTPPILNSTDLLQDVLKAISIRSRWNSSSVRVSKLDLRKSRYGSGRRYEVHVRVGKKAKVFVKFPDEVANWRRFRAKEGKFGDLIRKASEVSVLDDFTLEGPLDLRVDGGHRDEFSIRLPLNTTHSGLKRVFVGEGITLKVKDAQVVSLFNAPGFHSSGKNEKRRDDWPYFQSICMPMVSVRVSGFVSLNAYRTRNPDAPIEVAIPSTDSIELLPEKCYTNNYYKIYPYTNNYYKIYPGRVGFQERMVRSLMSSRISQVKLSGLLKANAEASSVIQFQLQLERSVGKNESYGSKLSSWRTRPTNVQVWFEVVARLESGKLKPLLIKKVRPFDGVDTISWSTILPNISFTRIPSVLMPPEALTLDVKW